MKRRLISSASLLAMLLIAFGIISNWQYIKDSYIVKTSELQSASAQILPDLQLTQEGEFLFKASQPQIQSAAQFSNSCKNVAQEQSIVLGCYTRQKFYVYNVKDTRLEGVKQVTAAHELLHAVYERLSEKEKNELNTSLITTAESINDERFKETLAQYRRSEPDQIENELHSILGTEIEVLPTNLEAHFQKYFKNRGRIVSFAKQYEGTFTELDSTIKQYDVDLENLRIKKGSLESELTQQQAAIDSDQSRLNSLRSTNPAQYNQLVPEYNERIRLYNQNIATVKQVIEDYNILVEKRNKLATTQNDLIKQLDSDYKELE